MPDPLPRPALSVPLPGPDALHRARLLAGPEVGPGAAAALEHAAGRPVERGGAPDGGPYVYVGATLPEALRGDGLVWFHSVNAGTDALLGAGPWPPGALLTRTVGLMGERIAQYVLAWVLAECQSVPEFAAQHARAEWRRIPSELAFGRTAVVHGTGRIGSAVAALLRACGIRTVGVVRTPRPAPPGFDATAAPDEPVDARWVVAALPLTAGTDGYFEADRFAAMGGATFVNVGRGATVDLKALAAALDAGTVGRAVLDVLPDEPAPPDHLCWRLPRTVVTSHSAGITADEDVITDFTACLRELRAGRVPALAVEPGRGY
ncbi:NAD(P)-dependent oxidoreductase [Streptomyces sp. NPDC059783]|uniref:NAD(P)-dependent oxidoreductase n=1 Tax=Streptomyces sp. NPDC059783 TaxID=3346944 RepID=UPI0036532343